MLTRGGAVVAVRGKGGRMSEKLFRFEDRAEVRVETVEGTPWFVARDVCEAIGLTNVTEAVRGLDDDERCSVSLPDGTAGTPVRVLISESGLYALVMRSNKPKAREFRRWVTGEVLPTIHRMGGYLTPEKARELMTNPETVEEFLSTMLALTATLRQKQARLEGQNAALVAENEGLAEDAEMARKFLVSRNAVTSSQLAARFGKSARFLNEWLRRKRLLKKVNRQWLLAGRWGAMPFMSTRHNLRRDSVSGEMRDHPDSLWTARGQLAVSELLVKDGFEMVQESEARTSLAEFRRAG